MRLVRTETRKKSSRPYKTTEQLKRIKGDAKFQLEVEKGLWKRKGKGCRK